MIEPELPTHDLLERVAEATAAIRSRTRIVPRVAVILGSGLSRVADGVRDATEIPTSDLPHWPRSTVAGHAGRLILGEWMETPVAVVAGRSHRYEGYELDRATFGVRVLHALGTGTMIFTNAAGAVGAGYGPGDLMLATDHLNFVGKRGLFTRAELAERRLGRRVAAIYDAPLAVALTRAAERAGVPLARGVLLGMHGPSYETAAEIRWARSIGAGAVCMSTVPEATVAAHLGCRVASLSALTNLATGLGAGPLSHDEVTQAAGAAGGRLRSLLEAFFGADWPDLTTPVPSASPALDVAGTPRDRSLDARQRREREFHDRWASEVSVSELDPIRRAFCPTTPETTYALKALGDLSGRRVLDLGCGPGETSAWLAMQGARVDAVDLSPGMIEVARGLAERIGVSDRITFHVAAGESLPFVEAEFDAVFGHDCLHHMDLERARDEVRRVLKPGCTAVFAEPLGHNPIINHFRDISPRTRTPDEVPLRFLDFARLGRGFRAVRHREFQFATLSLFLWFFLVERSDPNQVRYWKKIIVEAEKYRAAFSVLDWMDRAMLALVPAAGRLCRMTVVVLER